jgi:tetratricopeptide (TPR) repeat protein
MLEFERRIFTTSSPRGLLIGVSLILALFVPLGIEAAEESIDLASTYDPKEIYMLPVYCKYTPIFRDRVPGGNDIAQINRYNSTWGEPQFRHMHHYCRGLMASNRAAFLSRTPQDRGHNWAISINEFDYVIPRMPEGFPLLPEMHTKKAESLIRLDRGSEAVHELRRATEIKPNYWPAYATMSDYYKEKGNPAAAREWLEKGLSAAPDAKVLKQRLAELDAAKGKRKSAP